MKLSFARLIWAQLIDVGLGPRGRSQKQPLLDESVENWMRIDLPRYGSRGSATNETFRIARLKMLRVEPRDPKIKAKKDIQLGKKRRK